MKRRVIKVGYRRYRVELPGGDRSEFSYREKPRKWDSNLLSFVDFEPSEYRFSLWWDGAFMEYLPRELDVLLFIVRFGYGVRDQHLVPSELLADLGLVYQSGSWLDSWGCTGEREVVFPKGPIKRPLFRNLHLMGYPPIIPVVQKSRIVNRPYAPKVRAEVKIPKLDFAKLEKPRRRRRSISWLWADPVEASYGSWQHRGGFYCSQSDEECVFTLEIGEEAEKAHQARKRLSSTLQE